MSHEMVGMAVDDGRPYGNGTLPAAIRSRVMHGVNGLDMHVLEAGFEQPGRPALLLLHGFPELAFSWRKIMVPLAQHGFHVIAPDVRGYGRTTGWDPSWEADAAPFSLMNQVRDAIALVYALGHDRVEAVLGHDAGSPIAAWAALTRPDFFRSVMLLSTPFPGPPMLPIAGQPRSSPMSGPSIASDELDEALARLDPPRQHYIRWYATRAANEDMLHAPQGLQAFFRAYYHMKSADWAGNSPHRLTSAAAAELATLPYYYVMRRDQGMADTVAEVMSDATVVERCHWLTDAELAVYATEYGRTGFSGGLWAYRRTQARVLDPERLTHANRRIGVPCCFVSGARDWGPWQAPGSIEAMETVACEQFRGTYLVPGAGHWVQQEQPEAVVDLTLQFLRGSAGG